MAKAFKPQSPAVIERNRLRRARQHNLRMERQSKLLKIARGAARRLARKDIMAWKNRRKAKLQAQQGSIQGKTSLVTRVMATIEKEFEG